MHALTPSCSYDVFRADGEKAQVVSKLLPCMPGKRYLILHYLTSGKQCAPSYDTAVFLRLRPPPFSCELAESYVSVW